MDERNVSRARSSSGGLTPSRGRLPPGARNGLGRPGQGERLPRPTREDVLEGTVSELVAALDGDPGHELEERRLEVAGGGPRPSWAPLTQKLRLAEDAVQRRGGRHLAVGDDECMDHRARTKESGKAVGEVSDFFGPEVVQQVPGEHDIESRRGVVGKELPKELWFRGRVRRERQEAPMEVGDGELRTPLGEKLEVRGVGCAEIQNARALLGEPGHEPPERERALAHPVVLGGNGSHPASPQKTHPLGSGTCHRRRGLALRHDGARRSVLLGVGLHIDAPLEAAAVLERHALCLDVPFESSRLEEHDAVGAGEVSLDRARNLDTRRLDVRFDSPLLPDGDGPFLDDDSALDLPLDEKVLLAVELALEREAAPDARDFRAGGGRRAGVRRARRGCGALGPFLQLFRSRFLPHGGLAS